MTYIRTKDTIFAVVEETDLVYRVKAKGNPNNIYSKSKCATDVIKKGNEIKDVIDDYIIVVNGNEIGCLLLNELGNYDKVLSINKEVRENDAIIYGAIWTSKGLIYVAKMNEKGELELL